jgi:hypothetical protein
MYISHDIRNDSNDASISVFEGKKPFDAKLGIPAGKQEPARVAFSSSGMFSFSIEIKDIDNFRLLANALDAGEGNVKEDNILMSVNNQTLTITKNDPIYSFIANIYLSIDDVSRLRDMFLFVSQLE